MGLTSEVKVLFPVLEVIPRPRPHPKQPITDRAAISTASSNGTAASRELCSSRCVPLPVLRIVC